MPRRPFLAFLASLFARESVAVVTTPAQLLATRGSWFIPGGTALVVTTLVVER